MRHYQESASVLWEHSRPLDSESRITISLNEWCLQNLDDDYDYVYYTVEGLQAEPYRGGQKGGTPGTLFSTFTVPTACSPTFELELELSILQ